MPNNKPMRYRLFYEIYWHDDNVCMLRIEGSPNPFTEINGYEPNRVFTGNIGKYQLTIYDNYGATNEQQREQIAHYITDKHIVRDRLAKSNREAKRQHEAMEKDRNAIKHPIQRKLQ